MLSASDVRLSGRNVQLVDTLYLGWSGSFVEFETDSRSVSMDLCTDETPLEEIYLARVAVYVEDLQEPVRILTLRTPCVHVCIPVSDGSQMKTVRILRLTEAAFGLSGIRHLDVEDGARVRPTQPKARRIEFIGDSITCGYGIESRSPATFTTATENPTSAYAMLTARALDADCSLVAWSGIGLISSWVDASTEEPNQALLMSRLYPYHHLRLSERLNTPADLHVFAEDPADLVVINIGTNDSSWTRGKPEREALFGEAYLHFLEQVHAVRPSSPILSILGTMGQSLCDTVEEQVRLFQSAHPEAWVRFLRMPMQRAEDGLGADGHPTPATQRIAADHLIAGIQELRPW